MDSIEVFSLSFLKLLTVHSRSQLPHGLSDFRVLLFSARSVITCLRNYNTEGINKAALWIVEVWQRNWEVKDVNELVCLVLDGFCQVDKVLIHDERFLRVALAQTREALQQLSDVRVVDSIDLHKILE